MFSYVFKTGFSNLGTKKLFTLASIATISCCVFVFCLFFVLANNTKKLITNIESSIGIQVFFNENLTEEEIINIAENNFITDDVKDISFKSSIEAWDEFKKEYFGDKKELAEAFQNDNPLASSASYEILLKDINRQYDYINYLKTIEGVRQINYSNVLIDTLTSVNFGISVFFIVLLALLLIIAILLISNTITLAAQFRKKENEIMKLIGATNYMIRMPFVIEGFFIGLFGTIIPLIIICTSYQIIIKYFTSKLYFISNIFTPIDLLEIAIPMSLISFVFSCFVCMFVSFVTIKNHLKI